MKRIVLLIPAIALCAGCASHYAITLQNGQVITTLNKPVYDREHEIYTYKTMATISAGSVREIAPVGTKQTAESRYLPVPTIDR